MLPWFMISVYCGRYTIDVTSTFHTCLENRQQFFLIPPIVAFCHSILATMVRDRMQTVIIQLNQYSTGCIFTSVSIDYKWFREVWEL